MIITDPQGHCFHALKLRSVSINPMYCLSEHEGLSGFLTLQQHFFINLITLIPTIQTTQSA